MTMTAEALRSMRPDDPVLLRWEDAVVIAMSYKKGLDIVRADPKRKLLQTHLDKAEETLLRVQAALEDAMQKRMEGRS
jgi:hypothetical protein